MKLHPTKFDAKWDWLLIVGNVWLMGGLVILFCGCHWVSVVPAVGFIVWGTWQIAWALLKGTKYE